jgi:hypothetical protein
MNRPPMNRLQARSLEFEQLCVDLLKMMGYAVESQVLAVTDHLVAVVDIYATKENEAPLYANVKWTRIDPVSLQQLREWAAGFSGDVRPNLSNRFILMVSGRVEQAHRDWLREEFRLEIRDRNDLVGHAKADDELSGKFLELFKETNKLQKERELSLQTNTLLPEDELERNKSSTESCQVRGVELIGRLRSVRPGKDDAKQYEIICLDIIDYLFSPSLQEAQTQCRSEDGLNIFDIVYRVNPSHAFWETLTRDFRARVIVFECKNYGDEIGPGQVYTTERYMSTKALRSICFLLSRKGPNEHARLAAAGAMRDSGKLMIFLSDGDLERMISAKDVQNAKTSSSEARENDPTIILDRKIYDFIARLPR